MGKYSLTKTILKTRFLDDGVIQGEDGSVYKCFEAEPLSTGLFEEELDGPSAAGFFQKLSELLTRLPNLFDGQAILFRTRVEHEVAGFKTQILFFERVKKVESYSHLGAILGELKVQYEPLSQVTWNSYLSTILGP